MNDDKKAEYEWHVQEVLKPRHPFQASMQQMSEYHAEAERLKAIRREYDEQERRQRKLDELRRKANS